MSGWAAPLGSARLQGFSRIQEFRQAPFNYSPTLSGEGRGGGRTKVIEHESHQHHLCSFPGAFAAFSRQHEQSQWLCSLPMENHGMPLTAGEREASGNMQTASRFCQLHLAKLPPLWMSLTPNFPENFRTDGTLCDTWKNILGYKYLIIVYQSFENILVSYKISRDQNQYLWISCTFPVFCQKTRFEVKNGGIGEIYYGQQN